MKNIKAEKLIEAAKLAPKNLFVEIGCIRQDKEVPEDGYSTYYLAKYCHENNIPFISCDIVQENIDMANSVLKKAGFKESVINKDGKELLQSLNNISFVYYDGHKIPSSTAQQYWVTELEKGAVICIDDSHSFESYEFGKATDVIKIFIKNGIEYRIVDTEPRFKMTIAKFPNGKKRNGAI